MSNVALLLTAPAWRGSATSFAKIAQGLERRGHRVQIVTAAEAVAERFRALQLDAVATPLRDSGLASAARLRRVLRADVVLADAPRDVRLAALATLGRRTRVLWRFNLPNRPVPHDLLARALFRRLDGIICQSAWAEALLRDVAPWLATLPVARIPNGYDVVRLAPSVTRAAAFRASLGIAPEAPLVVTVGALSPEKGVPVAIDATARLRARHPALLHLLVGEGEDQHALRAGAPPHCRFLGALDPDATADAMRAADVVLLPSAREIFPNVVAEAMAVGAAVVTVRGGAAAEVTGDAARLVEPGAASAMAEAMGALLEDPMRRAELGQRARARIVSDLGLERMERGYAEVVSSVM